ncbi:MAG: hypothetical protein G3M70_06070 [Candidatus Nitronauta litoralis]|uniref:Uncharacterized protein n=1 Tax=Candidatus Nitronauta litoralis TaxID=2705533 RepID=A0A7T0BV96_9BACT|nr:MAG: hypothetical protein G3M70_06070 [Candidatus Nitronauta litoralis]
MKDQKLKECRAAGKGRNFCYGTTRVVPLVEADHHWKKDGEITESIGLGILQEITLCKRHHQELSEKGILKFFKTYDLTESENWEEDLEQDRNMNYLDPGVLEGVANSRRSAQVSSGYGCVPGYEDLRQANIILEEIALTDKQLMAICLVFYGGVKKKHAARAMKISAQALSDHIKAALKKIKSNINNL